MNVMGPAHRGNTIQALAQNAAQGVLRRQRMRQLLQQGAAAAGTGGAGVSKLFRSSMDGHGLGTRGGIQRPGLSQQVIAQLLRGSGGVATMPGGSTARQLGGAYAAGGGGYDFGSIADPNDPA